MNFAHTIVQMLVSVITTLIVISILTRKPKPKPKCARRDVCPHCGKPGCALAEEDFGS